MNNADKLDLSGVKTSGILERAAFPVIMIAAIAGACLAYTPERAGLLISAIFLTVMIAAVLLERCYPFMVPNTSEMRQDAAYFLITVPTIAFAEMAATTLGVVAVIQIAEAVGHGVWPLDLPFALQIVLALLISDFLPYLYHRMSHELGGILWKIHSIHHAPSHLYTLNFIRLHPLNSFISKFLGLLPLAILGVPAKVIFVVAVIQKIHSVLSHTNFDFRLGPLNWIFSMVELHRWHHVKDIRLANANYGSTLIIWDVLFRTRKLPSEDIRAQPVGLSDPSEMPTRFWAQICLGFGLGARCRKATV